MDSFRPKGTVSTKRGQLQARRNLEGCYIGKARIDSGGDRSRMPLPVLQAQLQAPNIADGADDSDRSEYLVRVDWIKTLPASEAIWEKVTFLTSR